MDNLFLPGSVLMFHSRSKDAPPGTGVGEAGDPASFAALAAHKDWRQKLSNFEPSPFTLDGRVWPTVEHFFQGNKFKGVDDDYCSSFSCDSDSALSRADGAAARSAGGRKGRPLTPAQIAAWDAKKHDVMKRALETKYR